MTNGGGKKGRGKSKGNKTRNRSSVTGRFVTDKYAKKHPRTTIKEKVKDKP